MPPVMKPGNATWNIISSIKVKTILYTAPWIVPVDQPAIADGGLLIANNRILECGPAEALAAKHKNFVHKHFDSAVIAPSWVNAHCHLELSVHIPGLDSSSGFVSWVRSLMAGRSALTTEAIVQAANEAAASLRSTGCALVGDITNGDLLAQNQIEGGPERVVLFEILGFQSRQAREKWHNAINLHSKVNNRAIITAHAPYSTSPQLMQQIKNTQPKFFIHAAESPAESEFIKTGSGEFRDLLRDLQVWDTQWQPSSGTVVKYLDELDLLGPETVLVHGVHVTDQDIQLLAAKQATVCICPMSNAHLKVGLPPIQSYLEHGIQLCIGTDSLASNSALDMNREIVYIYEKFDNIEPAELVRMATLNGAKSLGRDDDYGSLEQGKVAAFNVFFSEQQKIVNPEKVIVSGNWSQLQCF